MYLTFSFFTIATTTMQQAIATLPCPLKCQTLAVPTIFIYIDLHFYLLHLLIIFIIPLRVLNTVRV